MSQVMKLGDCLRELKRKQAQLVRKISLRESTFSYKKDERPEVPFTSVTSEIKQLAAEIRDLKLQIEFTNNTTHVDFDGEKCSIADLILRIGDLRSELKQLNALTEKKRFSFLHEDEANQVVRQLNQVELNKEIDKLEAEKDKIDRFLQKTNWVIELKTRPKA